MQPGRVLIIATTTGYQTRAFGEVADRMGVELVFATDRCHQLDDPWRDSAIAIRFHDEAESLQAVLQAVAERPVGGVIALGDRPTVIAARVAQALGLPGNDPGAAETSRNKLATRRAFQAAGLPTPWFRALATDATLANDIRYPCVVKPLVLAGSRGVMRADNDRELGAAVDRLRQLLGEKDVRVLRDPAADTILVEGFIPGRELAVEGLLEHGELHVLAIFDKPDPLDGPFFEETIYVTPSRLADALQGDIAQAIADACAAIGLWHGPVHAECRVDDEARVWVLEVAARPIGGLCARALRFVTPGGRVVAFEELLLSHAMGGSALRLRREREASGVMMVPIPRRGIYRRVEGVDEAERVAGVTEVRITAKPDQRLLPLPEGASYLGFIFARAETPDIVEGALREAHRRLTFVIDPEIPIVSETSA